MLEKKNLSVGMTVYISGDRRGRDTGTLTKASVSKIGRKWIEVEPSYLGRFSLETGMEDAGNYTPVRRMYLSADEYYDAVDRYWLEMALTRINCQSLRNIPSSSPFHLCRRQSLQEFLPQRQRPLRMYWFPLSPSYLQDLLFFGRTELE